MTDFELKYSINPEMNFQKLKEQLTSLKNLLSGIKGDNIVDDKETINNIKNIEKEISKLDKEIDNASKSTKKIDDGLKETSNTAGKMKEAFVGAFAGFTAANAVTAGLSLIKDSFNESLEAAKGFNSGLAELQAVTGVSGKGLESMGQSARDLAMRFGTGVNEQLTSFSGIISNFGPDLAKTPAALNSMTESVNKLAVAGLMPAGDAMSALNTVMNQFGIDAKDPIKAAAEYARISNILSAAAAVGSASIQDTAESMKVTGTAANLAGMSIEETAAAIQTMNLASLKGSEGGTVLRNVIGLLQKNSMEADKALSKIGLSTKDLGSVLNKEGLGAAMELLRKNMEQITDPAEKNALLMQVFGDNTAGANVLMQNATGTMKEYQKGLTGTNDATRQSDIILASYAKKMAIADAAVMDMKLSVGELLLPVVAKLSELLGWAAQNLDVLAPALLVIGGAILTVVVPSLTAMVAGLFATGGALAFVNLTAGIWITVATLLVTGLILLYKHSDGFRKIMDAVGKAIKDVAIAVWDGLVGAFNWVVDTLPTVIKFFLNWLNPIGLIYNAFKKLGDYFPALKKAITAIEEAVKGAIKWVTELFSSTDKDTDKTKKNTKAKKDNTEEAKKKAEADKKAADAAKKKSDADKKAEEDAKNKNKADKGAAKAAETLEQKLQKLKEAYLDANDAAKKNDLLNQIIALQEEIKKIADEKDWLEIKIKMTLDGSFEKLMKDSESEIVSTAPKEIVLPTRLEIPVTIDNEALDKSFEVAALGWDDYINLITPGLDDIESSFSDFTSNLIQGNADAGKALRDLAFKQLEGLIPIFVTEIFGQSIGQLGPILGAIAAGVLTGSLYGLLGIAKSAMGADAGVIGIDGNYNVRPSIRDTIPVYLRLGESVITPEGTWAQGNKEMLEFMNEGRSFMEFPGLKQMLNQNNVSTNTIVNDNSDVLNKMNNNLLMVNDSINQISGRVHILDREVYTANKRYDKGVKNRRIY